MKRSEIFFSRLDEAGVKYKHTALGNGRTKVEVVFKERESDEQWHRDTLAVQGLIYHFQNRGWITGDLYMFIMQNMHVFMFNDDDNDVYVPVTKDRIEEIIDKYTVNIKTAMPFSPLDILDDLKNLIKHTPTNML